MGSDTVSPQFAALDHGFNAFRAEFSTKEIPDMFFTYSQYPHWISGVSHRFSVS